MMEIVMSEEVIKDSKFDPFPEIVTLTLFFFVVSSKSGDDKSEGKFNIGQEN